MLPALALAQQPPPGAPPFPGPPPAVRAQMEQARQAALLASLDALAPAHRAAVQAILAQLRNHSLKPRDASSRIDAIIAPQEAQAVLSQARALHAKMRETMRSFAPAGVPAPPHRWRRPRLKPDAGRFIVMIARPHRMPRSNP